MTVHVAATAPSAGSDDRLGEIARALGDGFHELDALGRLPSATASHLLGRIHAQRDLALLSPAYLSEAFLGRFEELPADALAGIRAAISHRDLVHLSGQEFGPSFLRYLRTLWRVKLWMNARARRGGRLARAGSTAADVVCYASRRLPGHASTTARRVSSRLAGWSSRGRSLATVLACAGLDESDLVVDFARGVAQPRRYRAYWHDASCNNSVVKLVGIDFIRSEQGCWLVEANVNPALVLERSQLYRRDPLAEGMVAAARDGGYRRLVYFDNSSDGVDPLLAERLTKAAAASSIGLQIAERPNVPRSTHVRENYLPDGDEHTLIIDSRGFPTSLDRLIMFKTFTYHVLERYKASCDEPDLHVPAWSSEPFMPTGERGAGFPNLIYKLPEVDQGQGLVLMRGRDPEHAKAVARAVGAAMGSSTIKDRVSKLTSGTRGLWQAYITPDFAEGRRTYKIRALMLLSPLGPQLLSAHRAVATYDVPPELPFGIVADPKPYVVNHGTGARYAIVPPEEEALVRRAAEAVGRGLGFAIERAFATQSAGRASPGQRSGGAGRADTRS
jgi:hypothetical protein